MTLVFQYRLSQVLLIVVLISALSIRSQAEEPVTPGENQTSKQATLPSPQPSGEAAVPDDKGTDSPEGVTPIMQGPLHEAFAEQFSENPDVPDVIAEKPPELIDEQPPQYKPDGEDVQWIPGYWGWDVQAEDYVWVSGIWRQIPDNQRWIPGYWAATDDGWQWVSGFWNDATSEEVTYLPEPPESLEKGPEGFAPEENSFWSAGSWHYENGNYSWQTGSWAPSRSDQIWVSDRYVWTPSGYIYRPGYWDYSMVNRGTLFCPVLFQPGYQLPYTPNYCIDVGPSLFASLYVAPGLSHYYYGNYYGYTGSYNLYPWLAYQQRANRYDCMYTYFACQERNAGWLQQLGTLQRQYQSNQRVYASRPTVSAYLQQAALQISRGYDHRGLHVASLQSIAQNPYANFNNPFHYHHMNAQAMHDLRGSVAPSRQFEHQRHDHEHANNHVGHHHVNLPVAGGTAGTPNVNTTANHRHSLRIMPTPGNGLNKHPRVPDLSKASGINQPHRHHGNGFGSGGSHNFANDPQGKADLNAIRQMNLDRRASNMQRHAVLGQPVSGGNNIGHHGHSHGPVPNLSAQNGTAPQVNPQLDAFQQLNANSQANSPHHSHRSRMAAQHGGNNGASNNNPQASNTNASGQSSNPAESRGRMNHRGNSASHQPRNVRTAGTGGNNINAAGAASNDTSNAFGNAANQASNGHRGHRGHMPTQTAGNGASAGGQQNSMAGNLDQFTQGLGGSHRGHNHSGMQQHGIQHSGIQHNGIQHGGIQQSSASMPNRGVNNMTSANMSSNFFGSPSAPTHTQSHRHNVQATSSAPSFVGGAPSTQTHSHHHGGRSR